MCVCVCLCSWEREAEHGLGLCVCVGRWVNCKMLSSSSLYLTTYRLCWDNICHCVEVWGSRDPPSYAILFICKDGYLLNGQRIKSKQASAAVWWCICFFLFCETTWDSLFSTRLQTWDLYIAPIATKQSTRWNLCVYGATLHLLFVIRGCIFRECDSGPWMSSRFIVQDSLL